MLNNPKQEKEDHSLRIKNEKKTLATLKFSEKNMESISKDISNATEQLIFNERYEIDRPAYHGGKYDGTGLGKILILSYNVFKDVSEYIFNNVNESEKRSNEEDHCMCDLFGGGFISLDTVLRKIPYPNHKWVVKISLI